MTSPQPLRSARLFYRTTKKEGDTQRRPGEQKLGITPSSIDTSCLAPLSVGDIDERHSC